MINNIINFIKASAMLALIITLIVFGAVAGLVIAAVLAVWFGYMLFQDHTNYLKSLKTNSKE